MEKRYYLYGVSDASNRYKVVWREYIEEERFSIKFAKILAEHMVLNHPGIKQVYMMDGSKKAGYIFKDAQRKNTYEAWIEFKDILEREGAKLI